MTSGTFASFVVVKNRKPPRAGKGYPSGKLNPIGLRHTTHL